MLKSFLCIFSMIVILVAINRIQWTCLKEHGESVKRGDRDRDGSSGLLPQRTPPQWLHFPSCPNARKKHALEGPRARIVGRDEANEREAGGSARWSGGKVKCWRGAVYWYQVQERAPSRPSRGLLVKVGRQCHTRCPGAWLVLSYSTFSFLDALVVKEGQEIISRLENAVVSSTWRIISGH